MCLVTYILFYIVFFSFIKHYVFEGSLLLLCINVVYSFHQCVIFCHRDLLYFSISLLKNILDFSKFPIINNAVNMFLQSLQGNTCVRICGIYLIKYHYGDNLRQAFKIFSISLLASKGGVILYGFCFFFLLAVTHSMWDLSSQTKGQTCTPCIGSPES